MLSTYEPHHTDYPRLLVLLPIYEFIITVDCEVKAVWSRNNKLSISSILLVSIRWGMLSLALLNAFPFPALVRNSALYVCSLFTNTA